MQPSGARVATATVAALLAFAANSILCRLALSGGSIDAMTFTVVRVCSGAGVLLIVAAAARESRAYRSGSWISAAALVAYALAFSLAYVQLGAGIGALLLFGAVQLTIIVVALYAGERARWHEWAGLAAAAGGLVYLALPGLTAPPLAGSILMIAAGVAWGIYTIRGRGIANPLPTTTGNFVRAVPLVGAAVALDALAIPAPITVSAAGVLLAAASGGLTSAVGYVIWYQALRGLTAMRAAIVQLAVPVLTAIAGIALLGEQITMRLIVAGMLILGGIAVALLAPRRR
jgi:drug/metabolite transporter (DMT)-like permease